MKKRTSGGGWKAVWYTWRKARGASGWKLWKFWTAMRSKNACKTCALGMGGQAGGMVNESGHFPEVCKKSLQAMASDMQGAIKPDSWKTYSVAETKDAICFGQRNGEIFQNITGGKKPYNYLWQDGAQTSDREKLLKGKYACNITDVNKCKSTFTYTINEPDELIQTVETIIAQTTIKKGAII